MESAKAAANADVLGPPLHQSSLQDGTSVETPEQSARACQSSSSIEVFGICWHDYSVNVPQRKLALGPRHRDRPASMHADVVIWVYLA